MNKFLTSLLVLSLLACQQAPQKQVPYATPTLPAFENHLVPSVQSENAPFFFNLSERMDFYQVPGFSVATIADGTTIKTQTFGYARQDTQTPVDENTIFQAGSISKSITALIVLKLQEQSKLSLDADVSQYLKTWQLPDSKFLKERKLTLRNLLSHTSGLRQQQRMRLQDVGVPSSEALPALNDLLSGKTPIQPISFDAAPGAPYRYSNQGFNLIQKILEDLTGTSFEQLAAQLIFEPLKMTNSSFKTVRPHPNNTQYSYAHREGKPYEGAWKHMPGKASGGLYATPTDLAKLMIELTNCRAGKGSLLSAQSMETLFSSKGEYGLGFDLYQKDSSLIFSHSGRTPGFFAYLLMEPSTGKGFVMMTNSDGARGLFSEVLRGFAELNRWKVARLKKISTLSLPAADLQKFVGAYRLRLEGEEYILDIQQEGEHLTYSTRGDREIYPLRAVADTSFIDMVDGDELVFEVKAGKVLKVRTNDEYDFIRME